MYSVTHGLLPKVLCSMFQLNSSIYSHDTRQRHNIHQISHKLNVRKFTVRIAGPLLWNALPTDLRSVPNEKIFSSKYKRTLINSL